MWIIKNRKIFYGFSAALIAFSIFAISFWGIKFGIDFTGGSILEFEYIGDRQNKDLVEIGIESIGLDLGDISLREAGENGYIMRSKEIDNDTKDIIINSLGNVNEVRFSTIGPVLGEELKSRALVAILLVVVSIIMFIAYAFREVSKPVSSWKYGLIAISAFAHDVLVPVGLFALLGQFAGVEVDTLFVVAILVVLGYSINDTIVVFDRVRENLQDYPEKKRSEQFENVVGKSLKQTITRSIYTSLTTLITLLAIFILGGESTKWFSLALMAGVISGTYSSIFFAAPMLVSLKKRQEKKA